eukprot:2576516-Pleurochrysis_carterae.AAC.1
MDQAAAADPPPGGAPHAANRGQVEARAHATTLQTRHRRVTWASEPRPNAPDERAGTAAPAAGDLRRRAAAALATRAE